MDKTGLQKAGIDMSIFTPHSTGAASTSKAVDKVPWRLYWRQQDGEAGIPLRIYHKTSNWYKLYQGSADPGSDTIGKS